MSSADKLIVHLWETLLKRNQTIGLLIDNAFFPSIPFHQQVSLSTTHVTFDDSWFLFAHARHGEKDESEWSFCFSFATAGIVCWVSRLLVRLILSGADPVRCRPSDTWSLRVSERDISRPSLPVSSFFYLFFLTLNDFLLFVSFCFFFNSDCVLLTWRTSDENKTPRRKTMVKREDTHTGWLTDRLGSQSAWPSVAAQCRTWQANSVAWISRAVFFSLSFLFLRLLLSYGCVWACTQLSIVSLHYLYSISVLFGFFIRWSPCHSQPFLAFRRGIRFCLDLFRL